MAQTGQSSAHESVKSLEQVMGMKFSAGAFAENILPKGIRLHDLSIGIKLRIGSALCEVTQIGKECLNDCAIRKVAGDCGMLREGIFVRVLENGIAECGDMIHSEY